MKTVIEVAKDDDGVKRLRVYHRAGTTTVDGDEIPDSRYAWQHLYSERDACSACTHGVIPPEVRRGRSA